MPTGQCFDDAIELFQEILEQAHGWEQSMQRELVASLRLVHAIVMVGDKQSAHAWVEDETHDLVYFTGFLNGEKARFAAPRGEYRAVHGVVEELRYNYSEMIVNNRAYRTFGPWNHKYLELCGQDGSPVMAGNFPCRKISE
jgi:hypothetical protein